jgi:hypothetical protein
MAKVKRTLTLDESVIETFSADDPDNLSGVINSVLLAEQERRFRRQALGRFLDSFDAEFGAPDTAEVERFRQLLA